MTSIGARAAAAKSWLAGQHILANNDWLSGCVEYLCSEGEVRTQQEINELAREQWLLNDLRDVCPGCLPPGLLHQDKTVLPGRYVVQVNCTLDIGTPMYQQYQKLKKVNNENIEETTRHEDRIPHHRVMKLYLTDGVQEIFGMEYRTMRNLTSDLTPGCKLLLKGPVECRRGMLLLQEQHVEVLGGEVEDLAAENSLAAVFSRLLGVHDLGVAEVVPQASTIQNIPVPVLPPDTHRQMNLPNAANSVTNHHDRSSRNNRSPGSTSYDRSTHQSRPPVNFDRPTINMDAPGTVSSERPVARVTGIPVADTISDDEIDLVQIAAIEEQLNKPESNKRPLWMDCTADTSNTNLVKKFKMQSGSKEEEFPNEDELPQDDMEYLNEMEMASFENDKVNTSASRAEHLITSYPINVPAEPFVYIKQLKAIREVERIGKVFRIKAQIMKLLSKLSLGKEGWSLRVTLIDGTGTLDVDFTSDVLGKVVGISASEMTRMKKETLQKADVKERAMVALNAARHSLQILNCIIEITYLETPKVTKLIPFTEEHCQLLNDRLALIDSFK